MIVIRGRAHPLRLSSLVDDIMSKAGPNVTFVVSPDWDNIRYKVDVKPFGFAPKQSKYPPLWQLFQSWVAEPVKGEDALREKLDQVSMYHNLPVKIEVFPEKEIKAAFEGKIVKDTFDINDSLQSPNIMLDEDGNIVLKEEEDFVDVSDFMKAVEEEVEEEDRRLDKKLGIVSEDDFIYDVVTPKPKEEKPKDKPKPKKKEKVRIKVQVLNGNGKTVEINEKNQIIKRDGKVGKKLDDMDNPVRARKNGIWYRSRKKWYKY